MLLFISLVRKEANSMVNLNSIQLINIVSEILAEYIITDDNKDVVITSEKGVVEQ